MSAATPSTLSRKPAKRTRARATKTLPRGRHGLPREVVAQGQRRRLIAAAAHAHLECDRAALSVRQIIARARVSRATFYEQFDGKRDCLATAQREAAASLAAEIGALRADLLSFLLTPYLGASEASRIAPERLEAA